METNSKYGPEILVNGTQPDWLGDFDLCMAQSAKYGIWYLSGKASPSGELGWEATRAIRLRADHPYYQRAEYKASAGDGELVEVDPADFAERAMIAKLRAEGYTVTPPDPMIKDREFVQEMWDAVYGPNWANFADGAFDRSVSAFMTYLRANKERI